MKKKFYNSLKYIICIICAIILSSCGGKKESQEKSHIIEGKNNETLDIENNEPIRR